MKGNKIYLVWNEDDVNEDNSDGAYWEQFNTIEDAVSTRGDGCEVWVAEPRLLGVYKRKVEMVKVKKRKARRHKS